MKRTGNLYEKIYDIDNLRLAHKNARKGKGWYKQVQEVDENIEYYLEKLQKMLINQTYETSKYNIFEIYDRNKTRTIYKLPYFPDRICQWAILQVIEPYLLKTLIKDTYSAIPNRGIHLALKRLKYAVNNDFENTQYCLKIDVSKYYPSISQTVLKNKLRGIFKDKKLLFLLDNIIESTEEGVPIGNYLSQWFGNFYLASLGHWLKEKKRVKYLFIYMDDIVILSDSKKILHSLFKDIEEYLNKELLLEVKGNWQIFPTKSRGIDFLGYRVFRGYTLLRKSTYKNLRLKSNKIKKKIKNGVSINYSEWCSINSYNGWLNHANCNNLNRKYILPLKPALSKYYFNKIKKGVF